MPTLIIRVNAITAIKEGNDNDRIRAMETNVAVVLSAKDVKTKLK
jgi:hypothetical protein